MDLFSHGLAGLQLAAGAVAFAAAAIIVFLPGIRSITITIRTDQA